MNVAEDPEIPQSGPLGTGKVKFVIVSDLHLGAQYSVLTKLRVEQGSFRLVRGLRWEAQESKSQTLISLARCLGETLRPLSDPDDLPHLVLLGDLLDLSFASWHDATVTFMAFIDEMFPRHGPRMFSDRILLVPGNHDHQLWTSVKDRHYSDGISRGKNPTERWQITDLLDGKQPLPPSDLLNRLVQVLRPGSSIRVDSAYPNFAVQRDGRIVIMHHGHFLEGMYKLMTTVTEFLFPDSKADEQTASRYECRNGDWIDFGWSSLGGSGLSDEGLRRYQIAMDGAGSHQFLERLGKQLVKFFAGGAVVGEGEISDKLPGMTTTGVATAGLEFTAGRALELERNAFLRVLSDDSIMNLKQYLIGPVTKQLLGAGVPQRHGLFHHEVSFIFGHTHKPFQDRLIVRGFLDAVSVFNTGGWVLDLPKMATSQGAAAVLVDDRNFVASLRLFNLPMHEDPRPVWAAGVGGQADRENLFLKDVVAALQNVNWSGFTEAFLKAMQARAVIAKRYSFNPDEVPGEPRLPEHAQ